MNIHLILKNNTRDVCAATTAAHVLRRLRWIVEEPPMDVGGREANYTLVLRVVIEKVLHSPDSLQIERLLRGCRLFWRPPLAMAYENANLQLHTPRETEVSLCQILHEPVH